jgi:hypothetical protein
MESFPIIKIKIASWSGLNCTSVLVGSQIHVFVLGAEWSVTRQCELLDLNRSGVYYTPRPVSDEDLILMRRIDELHLKHPFYGARRLAKQLVRDGFDVGRRKECLPVRGTRVAISA